jgi:hypothetical protein
VKEPYHASGLLIELIERAQAGLRRALPRNCIRRTKRVQCHLTPKTSRWLGTWIAANFSSG